MKIKPINKFLKAFLKPTVAGITLCPFGIYVKEEYLNDLNSELINHEKIHWKQQLEMLVIPFYIWYLVEYSIRYFKSPRTAYKNISFEKEAFDNDQNLEYLKSRKKYSWIKYLK
jgi:hypothetical protein